MMDNSDFCNVLKESFNVFLNTGSRSNAKLRVLHGAIARDLIERLGPDYQIKSLGVDNDTEATINGRYIDKKVDITILRAGEPIAGIAVKFVMQNYSQNSNNYFENMLGETANIRCKNIPYFQIFIIFEKLPYYKNDGTLQKWETFSAHNASKYRTLSMDNIETYVHVPTKTLLYVIKLPEPEIGIHSKDAYVNYYRNNDVVIERSNCRLEDFNQPAIANVIYNDYDMFAQKVVHSILAL